MDINEIRKQSERAKQSAECAQRLDYLLEIIDQREAEIESLKQQHEKDMQLLDRATKLEIKRVGVKAKKSKLVAKRVGRWTHLKWPTVHAMREDYVLNGMTIHAISQKYSVSFDTVKVIVTNQSQKWWLKEYQDVLVERGIAHV